MASEASRKPLVDAARVSLRAPSVHNTQPWLWRVTGERLELWLDPRWRLRIADPDGRLAVLSCGTALHHALVALRAAGERPLVRRCPVPDQPDLLARVTIEGTMPADEPAARLLEATSHRRTERGDLTETALAHPVLGELRAAANAEGVWLHLLSPDQARKLIAAAERAERVEFAEPDYREELDSWTRAPQDAHVGIPATVTPPRGSGYPATGTYGLLYGSGDEPGSWLQAGEALSAVWLTATVHGLAVRPVSSVIEIPAGRAALYQVLAGIGSPYLLLHIGIPTGDGEVATTPRRSPEEAIEIVEPS